MSCINKQLVVMSLMVFTLGVTMPSSVQAAVDNSLPLQVTPPGDEQSKTEMIVATVNGRPIRSWQVDAHALNSHMSSEDALEDLIDLKLVRAAAVSHGFNPPAGKWDEQERAIIEKALVQTLAIDLPAPRIFLIIDHAWLKDTPDEREQAAGRALLEQLRDLVAKGATIPEAFKQLQADGSLWHIGNHEEYAYKIISAEARDLPEGGLSEIIPGDGGLHLYKIHQRKTVPASSKEIRAMLSLRLRSPASIEYPAAADQ
jgi:hypothetical protein